MKKITYNLIRIRSITFIPIIIVIFIMPIIAQEPIGSIVGLIVDKNTGLPVGDVNIILENTSIGAASDKDGAFVIKKIPIGKYTIIYSSIGYQELKIKDIEIESGATVKLNISLVPLILKTEEIVVTGTRSDHLLIDVPVETYLVSSREISHIGLQTSTEAIRWVPGVNISGGAPNGAARRFTAMIHGLPSQYSMILVDGERIASEHIHTGINLNLVPISMIDRIEVVKGPASALYGSEAFGGVVNIITKPLPEKSFTTAEISYGEYNTLNSNISHGSTIGKFGYYLNGRFSHTDGAPDENDIKWDYNQTNLLGKFAFKISNNNTIKLNTLYYQNIYLRNVTQPKVKDTWLDIGGFFESKFNTKSNVTAGLTFSHFKGEYREDDNRRISGQINYENEIFKNNLLTSGLEIRNERFSRQATPQKEATITSAFLIDEGNFSIPLTYIVALRADHHPNIGTELTPKLSGLYRIKQKVNIRASYGMGFKAPSLQDLYEVEFDHRQYYRNGNPDLEPEYSTNYNLSLEYLFNDQFLARISGFKNDFRNMISVLSTGDSLNGKPVFQRENISEATSEGIETEFKIRSADLNVALSYTYCTTRDNVGKPLAYSPRHMINFRFYYNFRPLALGTMLSLEFAKDRFYNSSSGEEEKLEDYTLFNFHLNKKLFNRFLIFAKVENLLNQSFTIYEDGASLAGYGRTYLFGLRAEF